MGEKYMADTNVQRELQSVADRLAHHDSQLDKLTDVSVQQVLLTEQLITANQKIDDYRAANETRMEKLETKVEGNKTTITRWAGGLTMLVILMGSGIFFMKLFEAVAPAMPHP